MILAFGLINVLTNIGYLDLMMGTPVWPVTYLMLVAIGAGYAFLLNIIITFYAGELVWRERSLRLEGVVDALPTPTWTRLLAKLGALWVAVVVFIAAGMIALIGYQLSWGYTNIEPLLYAPGSGRPEPAVLPDGGARAVLPGRGQPEIRGLSADGPVSRGQRRWRALLHFNHYLYRYAQGPAAPYSDMNGWGHFVAPLFWFNAVLGVRRRRPRVPGSRVLGARLRDAVAAAAAAAQRAGLRGSRRCGRWSSAAALAAGAYIFYNTNVLNAYVLVRRRGAAAGGLRKAVPAIS